MDPKIRVLVVDDSVVFRSRIKAALDRSPEIEVVGSANNGRIALQKLAQSSVDVISLDMEMPEMSGLDTIREIRKQKFPVRIVAFSASTQRGSEAALEALSLGADDILPKPDLTQGGTTSPEEVIARDLLPKILQFREATDRAKAKQAAFSSALTVTAIKTSVTGGTAARPSRLSLDGFRPSVVVIGSSTGGPQALELVLRQLSSPLSVPVLLAQHMPPVFTATLAKRLKTVSGIECAEARNLEELLPNKIYVAPGDFHMSVSTSGGVNRIVLDQTPHRNSVRPSVDVLFESAAKVFGSKCLGIILTGMGEDGLLGCRALKAQKSAVAIQNKESCVVFGMPGAVFYQELYDEVADPMRINSILKKVTHG